MLVKDRTKSLHIKKLEVIQRRLINNHPKLHYSSYGERIPLMARVFSIHATKKSPCS